MAATFPLVPDRIINTTEEFSTNITAYENGKEQRSPNWENSKPTFKLVFKLLNTSGQNILIAHFKDRKGSYLPFNFVNHINALTYVVRFKSDKMPIEHVNVALHNFEIEVVVC